MKKVLTLFLSIVLSITMSVCSFANDALDDKCYLQDVEFDDVTIKIEFDDNGNPIQEEGIIPLLDIVRMEWSIRCVNPSTNKYELEYYVRVLIDDRIKAFQVKNLSIEDYNLDKYYYVGDYIKTFGGTDKFIEDVAATFYVNDTTSCVWVNIQNVSILLLEEGWNYLPDMRRYYYV